MLSQLSSRRIFFARSAARALGGRRGRQPLSLRPLSSAVQPAPTEAGHHRWLDVVSALQSHLAGGDGKVLDLSHGGTDLSGAIAAEMPGATVAAAQVEDLGAFGTEAYDAVTICLDDLRMAQVPHSLEEAYRLLRLGGQLVVTLEDSHVSNEVVPRYLKRAGLTLLELRDGQGDGAYSVAIAEKDD